MERKEEEALRAMIDLTKASNMIKYNEDIINWPKKEWFQSSKDKDSLKEWSKDEIEKLKQKALMKKQKLKEKLRDSK